MSDQYNVMAEHSNDINDWWFTLQRAVAVGMVVALVLPMMVVVQQFIPPLAVASVLFTLTFALTWIRPRLGAIGIGILSGFWLMTQLVSISMVIPDLTRPSATILFLISIGMIVFSAAGTIGLVGVLRNLSGQIAIRTFQSLGAILVGSLILSLLANL